MTKTAKIAISLPAELLESIERARLANGENRSQFFCRAVEFFLRCQRERELDERYVRGYLEIPETPEELAWLQIAGMVALSEVPWEDSERG